MIDGLMQWSYRKHRVCCYLVHPCSAAYKLKMAFPWDPSTVSTYIEVERTKNELFSLCGFRRGNYCYLHIFYLAMVGNHIT